MCAATSLEDRSDLGWSAAMSHVEVIRSLRGIDCVKMHQSYCEELRIGPDLLIEIVWSYELACEHLEVVKAKVDLLLGVFLADQYEKHCCHLDLHQLKEDSGDLSMLVGWKAELLERKWSRCLLPSAFVKHC